MSPAKKFRVSVNLVTANRQVVFSDCGFNRLNSIREYFQEACRYPVIINSLPVGVIDSIQQCAKREIL